MMENHLITFRDYLMIFSVFVVLTSLLILLNVYFMNESVVRSSEFRMSVSELMDHSYGISKESMKERERAPIKASLVLKRTQCSSVKS